MVLDWIVPAMSEIYKFDTLGKFSGALILILFLDIRAFILLLFLNLFLGIHLLT